jgi:hypothetical protein
MRSETMKGYKTMTKKQIKRYAIFLRKKTWGQFHYEDDNWYGFFSKKQLKKHLKKVSFLIKGKNYQYFCDCLFDAFDNIKLDWSKISLNERKVLQSSSTYKMMNKYID